MWKQARRPLLYLSLGMNLAFLLVLGFFVLRGYPGETPAEPPEETKPHPRSATDRDPGWSFYRQKIGVTQEQWKNLRPEMESFHRRAYRICLKIQNLRNEVLKLIESPQSNAPTIQSHEEKIIDLKRRKQRMFVQYMISKKQYLNRDQEARFFGILREHRDCEKHARFLENKPPRNPDHNHGS